LFSLVSADAATGKAVPRVRQNNDKILELRK